MLREDIGHIRHVCQHKLSVHLTEDPEGADVMRVFFGMDDEDVEALNNLLNWVADHGLERFFAQADHIEELRDLLYGD